MLSIFFCQLYCGTKLRVESSTNGPSITKITQSTLSRPDLRLNKNVLQDICVSRPEKGISLAAHHPFKYRRFLKIKGEIQTLPTGTFSQVVIRRGSWLMTVPISEAHVSPAQEAKAPSSDKHIQDAVYCLEKSTGISPGPFSIIYSRASSEGTPPLQKTCTQFLCPPM